MGKKQDLGKMLWEVRSSWCQGEGCLTGKMLLGKCMSCLLFFSRTAKVLAAIQSPSSGRGPFLCICQGLAPLLGPLQLVAFVRDSLHLLSFNPLFCEIRTAVSGERPQRPGPLRLLEGFFTPETRLGLAVSFLSSGLTSSLLGYLYTQAPVPACLCPLLLSLAFSNLS